MATTAMRTKGLTSQESDVDAVGHLDLELPAG